MYKKIGKKNIFHLHTNVIITQTHIRLYIYKSMVQMIM